MASQCYFSISSAHRLDFFDRPVRYDGQPTGSKYETIRMRSCLPVVLVIGKAVVGVI